MLIAAIRSLEGLVVLSFIYTIPLHDSVWSLAKKTTVFVGNFLYRVLHRKTTRLFSSSQK
jgi:hypothetical protein